MASTVQLFSCSVVLSRPKLVGTIKYFPGQPLKFRKLFGHTGDLGGGAGKGGSDDGHIRSSGGGMGKYAAYVEEEYMYKKKKEQLEEIKKKMEEDLEYYNQKVEELKNINNKIAELEKIEQEKIKNNDSIPGDNK